MSKGTINRMPHKPANLVGAVRFRVGRASGAWTQALDLLRQAAASPGYDGPPLALFERVASGIAEVRLAIRDWAIETELRRPPPAPRPSRAVRKLLAELLD
jgi:hypothetical protein